MKTTDEMFAEQSIREGFKDMKRVGRPASAIKLKVKLRE